MKLNCIPVPDVLPVDREAWAEEIYLSNFVNAAYLYTDLKKLPTVKSLLEIGPGQGLLKPVLTWRGYEVHTLDIDETFNPDYVGSVHDMTMFTDKQFDVVIASHVLEHFAVPYLDAALKEIARVGRYALIYLPIAGRHLHVRFMPGVKDIDVSLFINIFNYFHKPDGITPRYCEGQHFWETGMRGFRVRDLIKRVSPFFEVLSIYRNRDWRGSRNFILKSKI